MARRFIWAAGGLAAVKLVIDRMVPLPDARVLTEFMHAHGSPLLRLYDILGGGSVSRGSIFALGIMPYLSARAFVALARAAGVPIKANGRLALGLTVGLSAVQATGYALFTQSIPGAVSHPGLAYCAEVVLLLTSASTVLTLFAEQAVAPEPAANEAHMLPREVAVEVPVRAITPVGLRAADHHTPRPS
jgi:preprotein translocase subunit SecY